MEDQDGTAVQSPVASEGATDPTTTTQAPEVKPASTPLDEAKIAELVQRKVDEVLGRATETARREIQSVKDKATAEVSRHVQRATVAESTVNTLISKLKETDPAAALELENAQLRSRVEGQTAAERQQAAIAAQQAFQEQFIADTQDDVKELGVDINDSRLTDVGKGAKDWNDWRRQVLKAATKIAKEDVTKVSTQDKTKPAEDDVKSLKARIADLEKQLKGEANSVDTSTGTSGGKGHVVTLAEYQNADAMTAKQKVESGEWVLPRGLKL